MAEEEQIFRTGPAPTVTAHEERDKLLRQPEGEFGELYNFPNSSLRHSQWLVVARLQSGLEVARRLLAPFALSLLAIQAVHSKFRDMLFCLLLKKIELPGVSY